MGGTTAVLLLYWTGVLIVLLDVGPSKLRNARSLLSHLRCLGGKAKSRGFYCFYCVGLFLKGWDKVCFGVWKWG